MNLRDLANELGTSRPTVLAWMARWPDFPVIRIGAKARAYEFDPDAVVSFLREKRQQEQHQAAERSLRLGQIPLPDALAELSEMKRSATLDRIEAVRLQQLQREEEERAGHLIATAELSACLSGSLRAWQVQLRLMLAEIGQEHDMATPLVDAIEASLLATQAGIERDLAGWLPKSKQTLHTAA